MKRANGGKVALTIITGLVLAVLIGIHIDVNVNHYCSQMDADIASEALLATVIADNGMHIPGTWVASTGDRIIATPDLGAIFYKITGNMNLSMGIACSITMLILLGIMALYFRQIGLRWYEVFASLIVFLSMSDVLMENQSMLLLWAAYYVSHFVSLFLMLILYNLCLKKKSIPVWIWIVSLVLAVLNGLQGLHGCLYCFFPVLGVEILRKIWLRIRKGKDSWLMTIWLFGCAILSFVITKFLGAYGYGTSRNIRHAGEKLVNVVWPAVKSVVYFGNAPAVVAVICVLAAIGYVVALGAMLKGNESGKSNVAGQSESDENDSSKLLWSTLAPVAGFVIFALALTFTTMDVAPRYFISELFIVATGVGLFMNRFHRPNMKVQSSALVAIIAAMLGIIASRYYYTELIVHDNSQNTADIHVAQWMQENGYDYGYAIFDNANTITVMTNNEVKVRAVNNMKDMEGCKWLSDSTWYPPTRSSEGATCYLVSESAKTDFDSFLTERNPQILETSQVDRYTVYVLDHDYTVWVD